MKYPLPHKHHDVVSDVKQLAQTFQEIDNDITDLESKLQPTAKVVEDLKNRAIHTVEDIQNSEIQDIAAKRFLVVNEAGDGFNCIDGGGDSGGLTGQCSTKKSDENFDTGYQNIWEVSKNGTTVQENPENATANSLNIFCNELEIENTDQFPKANPTVLQTISDYELNRNESIILKDEIESFYETDELATKLNYGLVKAGDNVTAVDGILSTNEIKTATKSRFGTVQIGSGINIENGVISTSEIGIADKQNGGVVKLGNDFEINASGAMELKDMADAQIIYKLSQMKIINNGNVDLEESTLIYRAFVNEDLLFKFNVNFEPKEDFTFILEIISNGSHLIGFFDQFRNGMNQLPINRGTTKLKITKRLGIPYYEMVVYQLEAADPICLTPSVESCVTSEFSITSVNGGNWMPNQILRTAYDGYSNIKELNFRFETLVCVDYVNYLSRTSTIAMDEFILKGSNDGKNWTTLIYKNNEIIYGKIYTEIKGCFRYYNLKIGYTSDDNKPGGVTLWGTQVDNNESELIALTPRMSSNETSYAKLTANNIKSGSAVDITDLNSSTLMKMTKTGDDWIKYEFPKPKVANILEIVFRGTGEFYGFYGDRQPNWFKLEGSNDDETWDLLLERQYQGNENAFDGNVLIFHLNNEAAYKYYRLICVATNSTVDEWGICGFKLYQHRLGKSHFYSSIPILSSSVQDGYKISASSQYNNEHAPFYAFDGDSLTKWASKGTGNQWLQAKFPGLTACNTVKITSRNDGDFNNQAPKDFEIQGSLDGETWETLTTQEDVTWTNQGQTQTFEFENETAYQYYRLYIIANNGGSDYSLGEFSIGSIVHDYKRYLKKYDYLVPILGSDEEMIEEGVYKLTSSSEHSDHKRKYLFDKRFDTRFELNTETSGWVQVELPTAKIANLFSIGSRNDSWCDAAPRDYSLFGSNDGVSWTTLFSVTDSSAFSGSELRTHEINESNAYKYYRLNVGNSARTVLTFAQWNLVFKHEIQEY